MDQKTVRIRGIRTPRCNEIWVDGVKLDPGPSLKLRSHSPDGFNWGYCGSGPAQAALAICLHVFGDEYLARFLYQDFKFTHVSRWTIDKDVDQTVNMTEFLNAHPDQVRRAKDERAYDELLEIARKTAGHAD
jgi:hypothetical protein